MTKDLAICMPVFNEEDGISLWINQLNQAFKEYAVDLFIVNDCSTDNTSSILRKNFFIVLFPNFVFHTLEPSVLLLLCF